MSRLHASSRARSAYIAFKLAFPLATCLLVMGCSKSMLKETYPDVEGPWKGWLQASSAASDHAVCDGDHTINLNQVRLPLFLDIRQAGASVSGTASFTFRSGTAYDYTVNGSLNVTQMTLTSQRQTGLEQCIVIFCNSEVREHLVCGQQHVFAGTVRDNQGWQGTWVAEGFDDHGMGPFTTRGEFRVGKR